MDIDDSALTVGQVVQGCVGCLGRLCGLPKPGAHHSLTADRGPWLWQRLRCNNRSHSDRGPREATAPPFVPLDTWSQLLE